MSRSLRKLRALAALAAGFILAMPALSHAQYPDRPIRLVAPFPAGGFTDALARLFADRLSASFGKPVIVENRAGASGKIGEDFVLSSDADGYTLLIGSVSRPTLMKSVTPGAPDTTTTGTRSA